MNIIVNLLNQQRRVPIGKLSATSNQVWNLPNCIENVKNGAIVYENSPDIDFETSPPPSNAVQCARYLIIPTICVTIICLLSFLIFMEVVKIRMTRYKSRYRNESCFKRLCSCYTLKFLFLKQKSRILIFCLLLNLFLLIDELCTSISLTFLVEAIF